MDKRAKILSFLQGKYYFTKDSDFDKMIEYFEKRYILPLKKRVDIRDKVLLDVSCGFGWMAFAFLKQGGKFAYGLDTHKFSVDSANRIAKILSLDKKCSFDVGDIEKLPFKDKSVDFFSCLETLEHVENQKAALHEMARVTQDYVVIETPNGLFPKDTHNTGLILGNYVPKCVRRAYVKLRKKPDDLDTMTRVMNPFTIERGLKGFKVVSEMEAFDSIADWVKSRPYYMPYGLGKNTFKPRINTKSKKYLVLSKLYALIGNRIRFVLPAYIAVLRRVK